MTPRLPSIQVGLPAVHQAPDEDRPRKTGFWKAPVAGPVWLGRTNLAGDGQAAVGIHGRPDQAVPGYAASHYPLWQAALDRHDLRKTNPAAAAEPRVLPVLSAAWRHGLASA